MRFKVTGFTRFILIMVILVPLAYVIASYYNGKDGIEELKKLVKGQSSLIPPSKVDTLEKEAVVLPSETVDKDTYRKLLLDNESLKDSLVDKELKIRELERNLKLC
ncbi:MAG: hypothetical protein NWQ18_03395, partial [Saprospiraceae bacterium]|nr:hypothetical protein [Saprospiraceae bacterium]